MSKPVIFSFDMNSLIGRIFTSQKPQLNENDYFEGEPVYCLKRLRNIVENEIAAVEKLGISNTHIVLVFDDQGKNFRHAMYSKYKANRPPKHKDWVRQEQLAYDMFSALGFPVLRIPGVEADDVLATLAVKFSSHQCTNVIFTGDKDIMSLCDEYVSVFAGKQRKLYTKADVESKFEVPVSRVIDYLAIDGDTADNVPGIKGAGHKAAVAMLNSHPLSYFIDNPDAVLDLDFRGKNGVFNYITQHKDDVLLSKALVTLKTDVSLDTNLNAMKRKLPDYDSFLNGYMRPSLN